MAFRRAFSPNLTEAWSTVDADYAPLRCAEEDERKFTLAVVDRSASRTAQGVADVSGLPCVAAATLPPVHVP